jgi:dephospho-CoA kinase
MLCGTVMVVSVSDPAVQMKRLMARDDHLTEEDAKNRVMSQGDVREKARRCRERGEGRGVVVNNDEGLEELKTEIARAMQKVQGNSPRWWGWLLLLCPPAGVFAAYWTWIRNKRINKEWNERELARKAKL